MSKVRQAKDQSRGCPEGVKTYRCGYGADVREASAIVAEDTFGAAGHASHGTLSGVDLDGAKARVRRGGKCGAGEHQGAGGGDQRDYFEDHGRVCDCEVDSKNIDVGENFVGELRLSG
jgi:hypothetical protein